MIEEKFLFHNVNRGVKLIAAGKNLIKLLFFKIRLNIILYNFTDLQSYLLSYCHEKYFLSSRYLID